METHALTIAYDKQEHCIKTPVVLKNPFNGKYIKTLAIWDTGATNSVITQSSASLLELKPVSKAVVNGVHGEKEVNVYYVNVTLNNDKITINTPVTECSELSPDHKIGFLIGMDIITRGDFAITNFEGKTVMSFRVPSLQKIDFVRGIKENKPLVKEGSPNRNDLCPCGSGKKYKKLSRENI